MLRVVAAVALLVAVSSCQTFAPIESLETIELGMTKAEVSKLAGSPTHRYHDDDREAWEYCANGWFVDDYALVWFDGDQVIGKELVEDYEFGHCQTRNESFDWSNAPAG